MINALQVTAGRRDARDLLSLKEAVVLADVSEDSVRKDMERGVLHAPSVVRISDSRVGFSWSYVVTFHLVYSSGLSAELRRRTFNRIDVANWTMFPCDGAHRYSTMAQMTKLKVLNF